MTIKTPIAIEVERELAAAELRFSQTIRAAAKAGKFGSYGVLARMQGSRVHVLEIEWRETAKVAPEQPGQTWSPPA